jgi:hypothetical protein
MQPESLEGLRALVVEDEILIAEEIRERLTRHGLTIVGIVDTGNGAIEMAEREQPELVLMDIRLKGPIDGIEAARAIRVKLAAPVVFLTAHSDEDTLRRAKETDPFGYVLKPFNERDLVVAIEMSLHRHQLERRLKEGEKRYAATLASIGDGVVATDADGCITFMNPVAESLTQWRQDDAQGRAVEDVLPVAEEAGGSERENPCRQALRCKEIVKLTRPVLMTTRQGESIPIDDSAAPILGDGGQLLGAVMAFRDIREQRLAEEALKKAEDQLRQAQKIEAIGRLAGGIAHDFNNFLTLISACTARLLAGDRLDERSRKLVEDVEKAGDRAAGLTSQLLAFSRKQILQPTHLDLGQLIAELSRMLGRLLGEDVLLTTRAAPGLWPTRADRCQIEQVVMNLAVNARDAMPQGGRLTIETSNVELEEELVSDRPEIVPGRYVLLAVSDTGVGMDRATQERLFEPFFTTKAEEGTGLGLATVYGIVKQSGGFIYVYSEVGKGTVFRLYFPALPGEARFTSRDESGSVTRPGHETILLVEDDESLRPLLTFVLHDQGYTVIEADGGVEALRLLDEHVGVELVVTDVVMPGTSGREVARKARAVNPQVRVLFVSGYTEDAVVRHGISQGEAAFLQKPFTPGGLVRKVREVLDS